MKTTILARIIWLFILSAACLSASANNYYFSSSSGDDSRSAAEAASPATPWRSIQKLNAISALLRPGDSILFKRGEVFYGTIRAAASGNASAPIVYAAYGTGFKPVITALVSIDGWVQSGNLWEASIPGSPAAIQNVLINGQPQALGRYPNSSAANAGYLSLESYNGNTSLTDEQLPSSPDWTGAEIVIRKNRWVLDRNAVTAHNGHTITYTSESGYWASAGYGYFFQNHRAALDERGEWYYRSGKLGLWLPAENPASLQVEASNLDTLVSVRNLHDLVFDGLVFKGANRNAFELRQANRLGLTGCDISFAGNNAIEASDVSMLTVEHCFIYYSRNIACNINNSSNTSIRNNIIRHTGAIAGMGKGDSGSYEALMLSGDNNTAEYNTIDTTGYIPITFNGNHVSIRNNLIRHFAFVKDDGGGIYTWNNGSNAPVHQQRRVCGNIILDGKGAGAGTSDPAPQVHGIYIDDNADHVEVCANTVAGCGQYGIYLHNAHEITVRDNTLYNNDKQLVLSHDGLASHSPIRNIKAYNNIYFSRLPSQMIADYKSIRDDLNEFGSFDSNYYSRPAGDHFTIYSAYQSNGVYHGSMLDLEGWQQNFEKDRHSRIAPVQIPLYQVHGLVGSNKYANGSFNLNVGGLYAYAAAGNALATWAANGPLDGGSLRISHSAFTGTTARTSVIIGIGQVQAGKKYVLSFSLAGADEQKNLEVFFRKSLSPYNELSERKLAKIRSSRNEYEFLLTPTGNESDASLVFDLEEQGAPLYIDNLKIFEANVTLTSPADSIRFEYNAGSQPKTVQLDGTYVDARNNSYAGSIELQPFTSAVLIKQSVPLIPLPSTFLSFDALKKNSQVSLTWTVGLNEASLGYEVERSADGNHFQKIATIAATTTGGSERYRFTDSGPGAFRNYYRIKMLREDGSTVYSSIILVNFGRPGTGAFRPEALQLGPNPANQFINLNLEGELRQPAQVLLRSGSGALLRRLPFAGDHMTLDVSTLRPGIYCIQVIADGFALSKPFVRQ
ncbi:MAG TPA: right-handed parallel beta-helix repeat-containing protein [Flavisolibacter sp.]|nr:right-handed parallel beta-helix repeat-containing protein [Flavisolibacter sp.]